MMSFRHETTMSGKLASGVFKMTRGSGHWKLESAIRRGRKAGIIGDMRITHQVYDMGGHGRSGHDGEWLVDEQDKAAKVTDWQEGERTKMPNGKVVEDDGYVDIVTECDEP